MKIITRYVSAEFIKLFILIASAFTVLYLLIDVFENLGDFTRVHAGFFTIAGFFLLRLTQAI